MLNFFRNMTFHLNMIVMTLFNMNSSEKEILMQFLEQTTFDSLIRCPKCQLNIEADCVSVIANGKTCSRNMDLFDFFSSFHSFILQNFMLD